MSKADAMPTKYQPQQVESGKYQKWVEAGLFKPSGDKSKKPYSIVIPPPNVTGRLHLGHAWDVTLQDMLIRANVRHTHGCKSTNREGGPRWRDIWAGLPSRTTTH